MIRIFLGFLLVLAASPTRGAEDECAGFFRRLHQQELFLGGLELPTGQIQGSHAQLVRAITEYVTRRPEAPEAMDPWKRNLKTLDDAAANALEKELTGAGQPFTRYSMYLPELEMRVHAFAILPSEKGAGKIASEFWDKYRIGTAYSPLLAEIRPETTGVHDGRAMLFLPSLEPGPAAQGFLNKQATRARTRAAEREGRPTLFSGSLSPLGSMGPFRAASAPRGMRLDEPVARLAELTAHTRRLDGLRTKWNESEAEWNDKLLPVLREIEVTLRDSVIDTTQALYSYATEADAVSRQVGVVRTLLGATWIEFARVEQVDGSEPVRLIRLAFTEKPFLTVELVPRDRSTRELIDEMLSRVESDRVVLDAYSILSNGEAGMSVTDSHPLLQDPVYSRMRDILTHDSSLAEAVKLYLEADVPERLRQLRDFSAWQLDEQGYALRLTQTLIASQRGSLHREAQMAELTKVLKNLNGHAQLHAFGE